MASAVYNNYKYKLGDASTKVDFVSNTFTVSLHTSSYTPNIDSQAFYSDLSNELPTSGGYTSGGQNLASITYTLDTGNDKILIDATDPSWASSSFTARYMVLRKNTGVSATSPLILYLDFGTDKTADGGTFLIALNASGFLNFV